MIHYPSNLQPESSEMMTHMETMHGSENENPDLFPIQVSIGIHSGEVYLGSTKMRGTEREQWTFTASGAVTIMAAWPSMGRTGNVPWALPKNHK